MEDTLVHPLQESIEQEIPPAVSSIVAVVDELSRERAVLPVSPAVYSQERYTHERLSFDLQRGLREDH